MIRDSAEMWSKDQGIVRLPIPADKPELDLIGLDSNAFSIMDAARRAMRKHGYSKELLDQYLKEAMSGDYNNLIMVTSQYCLTEISPEYDDG